MIRAGHIRMKYLRNENGEISRFQNGKARQDFDHHGWPEYVFTFSSCIDLDCKFEKEHKPVEEQIDDNEIVDMTFDALVKDFAYELAKRMKYKNYKVLDKHGINPNMVIWDE